MLSKCGRECSYTNCIVSVVGLMIILYMGDDFVDADHDDCSAGDMSLNIKNKAEINRDDDGCNADNNEGDDYDDDQMILRLMTM